MEIQELYKRYSRDVYRFAYWISGSAADADDITSETFVRAWTTSRPVRTATAKAYLLRIARNLFLEGRRKSGATTELPENLMDPRPGPDRLASSASDIEEVRRVLRRTLLVRLVRRTRATLARSRLQFMADLCSRSCPLLDGLASDASQVGLNEAGVELELLTNPLPKRGSRG